MLICLASAVIREEETPTEAQKSWNKNVGGMQSLKHIYSNLLSEAGLSPALDRVSRGFVYPKSLNSPRTEIPQLPWTPFSTLSPSFQWKKIICSPTESFQTAACGWCPLLCCLLQLRRVWPSGLCSYWSSNCAKSWSK